MKRTLLLILLLLPVIAHGQVSSSTARRIRTVGTLPATCKATAPADVVIKTGASAGFYYCSATNTWTGPFNSNVFNDSAAYCTDAGASDTYACSLSPAPASYVTGARYRFKANTANTGAATINLNALGAKTIKKVSGGITTDLADNDIRVGQIVELTYDGTNMQMQSTLGNAGGGGLSGLTTGQYLVATSATTASTDGGASEHLLNSVSGIDLNAAAGTKTTLYTCPVGKSCIITKVVFRSPSTTTTTVEASLGWNVAGDDFYAAAAPQMTASQWYPIFALNASALPLGTATGTFKVAILGPEGSAATCTVDVFGYLF